MAVVTESATTIIAERLEALVNRDTLRIAICGSVDDGKSTLLGACCEAGMIPEDRLAQMIRDSRKHGTQGGAPDYALLLDGLEAEREQGITIDVAWRYFGTDKRAFIVADCPGHAQYTRNMATRRVQCGTRHRAGGRARGRADADAPAHRYPLRLLRHPAACCSRSTSWI